MYLKAKYTHITGWQQFVLQGWCSQLVTKQNVLKCYLDVIIYYVDIYLKSCSSLTIVVVKSASSTRADCFSIYTLNLCLVIAPVNC